MMSKIIALNLSDCINLFFVPSCMFIHAEACMFIHAEACMFIHLHVGL